VRLRINPGVTLRLPGGLRLEFSQDAEFDLFAQPDADLEVLTTDDVYAQLAQERDAERASAHGANGVPDTDQPPF
jgi:hypothetical protein